MKPITQITRIVVGVIFIISGFVKVIDPIGFSYKLEEYFSASVFNIPFLAGMSLFLAIFFAIYEVILGVMLLLGFYKKFTLYNLLVLIVFFTFLTFYSAYFDKVTDCGCFGDALKLTPWQSFYKDIALLALIILLFINRKNIQPFLVKYANYCITVFVLSLISYVGYLGISHNPIKDFRPYAVGKNIPDGMKSAEEKGLKGPEFETIYTLTNSQTKEVKKVSDKEYLDHKWYEKPIWVMDDKNIESVKVKDGYEPAIHDFQITALDGTDKTGYYLSVPKLVIITIPSTLAVDAEGLKRVNYLIANLKPYNVEIVGLSSGTVKNANFTTCSLDGTVLKTIIRSNPGIILLEKGTVVAKYHWHDTPTAKELYQIFTH